LGRHVIARNTFVGRLGPGAGFLAFNLGTGQGHSVREIIDAAKRITGRDIPTIEGPRRPGDPPRLVADATRARNLLGWQPKWNKIDAIIETAWRWHSQYNSAVHPMTARSVT